ncbi:hypothetical protein CFC21_049729, partial [Triticum aestivum]
PNLGPTLYRKTN